MGGKTSTSTSSVSVPPEILARYNSVNAQAQQAASQPFQQYSGEFVAPVNQQEQGAISNINANQNIASPSIQQGLGDVSQGYSQGSDTLQGSLTPLNQAYCSSSNLINQSLGTGANAVGNATNLYGQAVNTGQGAQAQASGLYNVATNTGGQAQQAAGCLYNTAVGTVGSAAGSAANQYNQNYAGMNTALAQGTNYNNAAAGNIFNATNAAQPYNLGSAALTGSALAQGQNYAGLAGGYLSGGTQAVTPQQFSQAALNQYETPFQNQVISAQQNLFNQQNAQQQNALTGNAVASGAFGGCRAGIAQATLMGQQSLAENQVMSNLLQQNYNQALGAFQQQQGVNLQACQANRAAQQFGEQAASQLGQQQYAQNLGAAQQFQSLGQQNYAQQLGQGQAIAGLGQQQYSQGMGTAGAQAGLVGQLFGMGQAQAQAQQAAAQGVGALGMQEAGLQAGAAQGIGSLGMQNAGLQAGAAQGIGALGLQQAGLQQAGANLGYNQAAQLQQATAGVGQGLFNMGQQAGTNTANLGALQQQTALQGNQAALSAGQLQQQTQQAQDQAVYNQFLQQQGYPFQTAQFLANIAEGTGALSGSTTSTTQPQPFFSDRRLKEDIRKIGETNDGMPIYKFKYKGDPKEQTHIGLMADEVEKKHPEAVGRSQGYKTVDYDAATADSTGGSVGLGAARKPFAGGGMAGGCACMAMLMMAMKGGQTTPTGAPAMGLSGGAPYGHGYVPSTMLPVGHLTVANTTNKTPQSDLGQLAGDVNQVKGLYDSAKGASCMAKSAYGWLQGLGGAAPAAARGGSIHGFAGGGGIDCAEPYGNDPSQEGYLAGVLKHAQQPHALMTAQNPTASQQSGLGQLAGAAGSIGSLYKAGTDLASGLGSLGSAIAAPAAEDIGTALLLSPLGFNKGGFVPRETHADGEAVGDAPVDPDLPAAGAQDASLTVGGDSAQPPKQDYATMVASAAQNAGVNSKDALAIARAESKLTPQLGDDNSSAGLMQLHVGGVSPKYPHAGLGDDFFSQRHPDLAKSMSPQEKIAYLNDPNNQQEATEFAMQHAAKNGWGAWSTAKQLGLAGGTPQASHASSGTPSDNAPQNSVMGAFGGLGQAASSIGDWFDQNQKWLIPVMSGLGAMASSNSRYLGSAILQGLGGAGQSYANLEKQQAEIAKYNLDNISRTFIHVPGTNDFRNVFTGATVSGPQMQSYFQSMLPGGKNLIAAQGNVGTSTTPPAVPGATKPTPATGTTQTTASGAPAAPAAPTVSGQPAAPTVSGQPAAADPQKFAKDVTNPIPPEMFSGADDQSNPAFLTNRIAQNTQNLNALVSDIQQGRAPSDEAATNKIAQFKKLIDDDNVRIDKIYSGETQIRDSNGNLMPAANAAIQDYKNKLAMNAKFAESSADIKKSYAEEIQKFMKGYGAQMSDLDAGISAAQKMDLNGFTNKAAEAVGMANIISSMTGLDLASPEMKAFQNSYAIQDKNATVNALNKVLAGLQRAPGAALTTTLKTVAEPSMPPATKFEILTKEKGELQHDYDKYGDWLEGGMTAAPAQHEYTWAHPDRSVQKYWKDTAANTPAFAGMTPATAAIVTNPPKAGSVPATGPVPSQQMAAQQPQQQPGSSYSNPIPVQSVEEAKRLATGVYFKTPSGQIKVR